MRAWSRLNFDAATQGLSTLPIWPHRRAGAKTQLVDFAALHEFGSGTFAT